MITKKTKFQIMELVIAIAVVCFTGAWPHWSDAQGAGSPMAMVDALQGHSDIAPAQNLKPTRLTVGRTIDAGATISTDKRSKVFLQWETGIKTSLGEVSSISLSQNKDQNGHINVMDVNVGIVRVTKQTGGGNLTPYKVITPVATIEPLNFIEPVDFLIEAYTPTTTAVSVISGTVLVKNLTLSHPTETIVSSCHVAYINKGKHKSNVLASKADKIMTLIDRTTIPRTVAPGFICPVPVWLSTYASGTLVIPRAPFSIHAAERLPGSDRISNFRNQAVEVRGPWTQAS